MHQTVIGLECIKQLEMAGNFPDIIVAPFGGGLRYHGAGAIVSQLLRDGLIEVATHAIATVIREARQAKEEGRSKTILFNLCGHGHFDMAAYEQYMSGKLVEHEVTSDEIKASLAELTTPEIA